MKKLNLGTGHKPMKGYINVDILDLKGVDVIHDLDKFPYPFRGNSIDEIYTEYTMEHMKDIIKTLKELHRICKPNAIINMIVSDEQRTCTECSDSVPCHACYHRKKQIETAQEKLNEEIDRVMSMSKPQEKTKEQIIAEAIANLNNVELDPKTSWTLFKTASATYDSY